MTDAATRTAPDGSPISEAGLMREQRLQRNLKIAIAAMGLVILGGLGAIAYKILSGLGPSTNSTEPVTALTRTPAGEIGVELPKGAKIVSTSVSGNRLAIHHESAAGTGIAIIDLETGRRIVDVKPLEAVPRN